MFSTRETIRRSNLDFPQLIVLNVGRDGRRLRGLSWQREKSFQFTSKLDGKPAGPSVPQSSMDGQSAKTTEGGGIRGFDAHKRVKGTQAPHSDRSAIPFVRLKQMSSSLRTFRYGHCRSMAASRRHLRQRDRPHRHAGDRRIGEGATPQFVQLSTCLRAARR